MARSHTGKFFILFLLLIFCFPLIYRVFANTESVVVVEDEHVSTDHHHEPYSDDALSVLNQHQIQLEKLEALVKNLSELVSRLESRFTDEEKFQVERLSRLGIK